MNTFSKELFESDIALDFYSMFVAEKSFSVIRRAIESSVTDDYLEYNIAIETIVALEIVNAIKGTSDKDFALFEYIDEDELKDRYESKIADNLMNLCQDALVILRRDEDSELFEEFDQHNEYDELLELLDDIEERLF